MRLKARQRGTGRNEENGDVGSCSDNALYPVEPYFLPRSPIPTFPSPFAAKYVTISAWLFTICLATNENSPKISLANPGLSDTQQTQLIEGQADSGWQSVPTGPVEHTSGYSVWYLTLLLYLSLAWEALHQYNPNNQ